jgi:hypothetical protein
VSLGFQHKTKLSAVNSNSINALTAFKPILTITTLFFVTACVSITEQPTKLELLAKDYFEVYAQRSDFNQFMAFYDDNAELRDIIYGNYLQNKTAIRHFLDWSRGSFKVKAGNRILTVTQQTSDANIVVTEGYFHAFEYDGTLLGPWLFSITLEFNTKGKIIKQTDWINYTPREQFLSGKNMNEKLIDKN